VLGRVTRREFLGTVGAGTLAGRASLALQGGAARPNVLFILGDDLGYGDLSCYGRPDYRTPRLDELAQQGVKLTSAYAASAVCTPTRCALATGRYPQRLAVGLEEPLRKASPTNAGLPPGHPTVASLLAKNGYETALIGKWHLGWKPEFGPNRHGYQKFFGFLGGGGDYFTHRASEGAEPSDREGVGLREDLEPIERAGYLTDLFSDKAAEFVGRSRSKPFFLSLHYNAPHSPWEGPEDGALDHTAHGPGPMKEGGSLAVFAAMMKSLDAGIGRVLDALDRAGRTGDTLVVFTSDNGGEKYSYHWPFSSQKPDLWEGGIRVPALVRWPGVVPAGRVTTQAAITMDWTATILAATGTPADPAYPLDGEDILPVCTGRSDERDRTLFWRMGRADSRGEAVRVGRWKYLKQKDEERLFDLSIDPGEKNDLLKKQPEVFEDLKRKYQAWDAQMLPRPAAT
jgi:arylsulfatase A-like enzyme